MFLSYIFLVSCALLTDCAAMLNFIVLHFSVLYFTVFHYTAVYSTILQYIVLFCAIPYNVLYCNTFCYLCYTVYTVL